MICNICGSPRHEATTGGCPDEIFSRQLIGGPTGWCCPACGRGNAPDAKTCGHCAERTTTVVGDGANSTMRTTDMPRELDI